MHGELEYASRCQTRESTFFASDSFRWGFQMYIKISNPLFDALQPSWIPFPRFQTTVHGELEYVLRHEINFSSKSPNLPYLPRFKLRQDFWTRNKEKIMNHSEIRIMGRYPNDIEKRNGRQNINSHSGRLFLLDLIILVMPTLLQWKESVDWRSNW